MIEINNLYKYISGNLILDDINLNLKNACVYGFVGRNGSGKTMLFRAICGLITIDQGEIIIDDKKVTDNDITQNIGLLLENPSFLNGLSGFNNLKMIASIRNIVDDKRIDEVIEIVGLSQARNKKFEQYSLGMKQRLAIANVIMEDPDILIFDEPTNAIDEEGIVVLKKIIKKEREKGKLILLASHEKEIIEELCDDIYYMKEGKIITR
ncbi:ABC transporter ATP-binding protein [Anaerococcus sp.]|uniref:ABC transporter ATP-binding protein n=1 Tax=Anaerococcus sp. TaxID=1872515 RepID=UPI0025858D8C|nr:ATP-binding cassette domain-containing protein [Anaerococcus sp.]MDU3210836.1 ATP-binding cassette domain-containing protein [Anaerococcus sp.]